MRITLISGFLAVISLTPVGGWGAPSKVCSHKVKETVVAPHGWVKHSVPPADHTITLRIGLPQPNFHILEKHLYEVSDPYHDRYGAHLSKEETEGLVAPNPESIHAVNKWLESHGIMESDLVRSPAKDWVTLTIPVNLAEKMLDTTYSVWKHKSGDQLVRTTSYSLPEHLHEHVELVQPTTMFGRFRRDKSTIVWADDSEIAPVQTFAAKILDSVSGVAVDPTCKSTITIKCLQQLYNTVGYIPKHKNNSIGITGYLEQFANKQDLQSFYAEQRPDALNSSFKFISVNGGLNSQNLSEAGAEAGLDVQFAFGLSHPIPGTFFSTAGRPPFKPDVGTPTNTNEPYTEWLDFMLSSTNVPLSISTSYGDDEQTVPESFARRACAGFAQLGARGVSLMFSSGDGGVGDNDPNPETQQCFTNDGRNVTRFIPSFPASVTVVGGTTGIPEVAVSRFFSGGGFSDYFPRPKYQDRVVQKYLKALPKGTYKGLFNPNGRAFPDVSAQSDRFRIFLSGRSILIGGTSASSPAFAGIVALLNDVRLSRGLPSLGFLNPLIYSKAAAGFNDITIGHNSGCGTTGFNATKGWDPVTGLGTPNFAKLRKLVV
ncbi:hypothetical protein D9615_000691 [Tricholomella constricta]|uniref:tripeptidyl-peptidase II n=1 Tax=Tricholomella constricta TaxID=117010 RepID=A0A8H5HRL0_9AGAR|nr:hypothetical protein D9615_000691 [Tricholomella constricta]